MGEPDVIDRALLGALLESIGGDAEFLGELLRDYFKDSPRLIEALHAALAAGNAAEFRRAAHTLKSTSISVGASGFAGLCKELEAMGAAGRLDGADAAVRRAEIEYARVRAALEAAAAG